MLMTSHASACTPTPYEASWMGAGRSGIYVSHGFCRHSLGIFHMPGNWLFELTVLVHTSPSCIRWVLALVLTWGLGAYVPPSFMVYLFFTLGSPIDDGDEPNHS